jgi:hypothetical protein
LAQPVVFGAHQFKTKKAATEAIRERISHYEAGEKLNEDDQFFFSELFKLHNEYTDKVGVGIAHIQIERDFHNHKCLYIHRIDGEKEDISWVHCVQPASKKTVVSVAFRRAVKEIVKTFKSQKIAENQKCPVLNISLDFSNSHAAYIQPTFDELLSGFLGQIGQNIESIVLENPKPADRDQRGILKDSALTQAWLKHHTTFANLELLSAEANLRK